ncbi:MAG: LapA family protein [Candidatus Neomarinimicrobiota bacterium]
MRLAKVFLGLLIILGLLIVLIRNTGTVTVDLMFKLYENTPLAIVLVITLAIGILIGFGIALTSILTSKTETRILRGESKRLSDELNALRNIALQEGSYEVDDEEE